jgi:zinc transport system substrate-binding protein
MFQRITYILVLLASFAVDGCGKAPPPAAAAPLVRVVSTVYPLADLAQRIGGAWVTAAWFCEGAADPRDLAVDDDMRHQVTYADVMITCGLGDSDWAARNLSGAGQMDHLVQPRDTATGARDNFACAGNAGLWLDPKVAMELCGEIRAHIAARDPAHETEFNANAAAVEKQLADLSSDCEREFAGLPCRSFVVLRPMWGALALRCGLHEIAPVNAVIGRLSQADVRQLKSAAADHRTGVLVLDYPASPAILDALHAQTGLKIVSLDALGSSAADAHHSYLSLMRYNLAQLKAALSAPYDGPPAGP